MASQRIAGALALWLWASSHVFADENAKSPVVIAEKAAPEEIADQITYPARVISRVKAAIYAPSDGVVTRVLTPLGAHVRLGQPILEIKNIDPVYEYVPVGIESPVAGIVSSVDVTAGSKVTKGQSLATVTDPRQIGLVVEVPASDLSALHRGLIGKFSLPILGAEAKPVETHVSGVSPMVDPLTGTATAELALVSAGTKMPPPGAIGKVTFALNVRSGIQISEQAVIYRGKETLIRKVLDGKAKLAPVTLGETRKGRTEVLSGVSKDDLVVVRASGFVADGQAVTVQAGDVAQK